MTRYMADADPQFGGFYTATVNEIDDSGPFVYFPNVANCEHHHGTRALAERCAERLVESLSGIQWHREPAPDGTPKWFAEQRGVRVAEAAMTGRHGADDYPWDVYTVGDAPKFFAVADTLRSAKEQLAAALK